MPRSGFKCLSVKEEVYSLAERMVSLGLARNLSDAVSKALKEQSVPDEVYSLAKHLVELGLERSVKEVLVKAVKEYVKRRENLIREAERVRAEWSRREESPSAP